MVAGLDNSHGLAIKEELENYYEGEIHHGRLYPNLDERTNFYKLTQRGRRELAVRGTGKLRISVRD